MAPYRTGRFDDTVFEGNRTVIDRKDAKADVPAFPLGDEQRMLLQVRDTLYEGVWEDFITDLRARSEGRPHLFITVPPTPEMKAVIARHLSLINDMAAWERRNSQSLRA